MKPTLTIGIAAYNEVNNIVHLLAALDAQNIGSADLKEILVVSDASDDGTDEIVRASKNPKVRLMRLPKRGGANHAQNVIMDMAQSDILVLLDGDILPENDAFIEGLIRPIVEDSHVGLTSAALLPARGGTFVEKVLARNHRWKDMLFASLKKDGKRDDSIYTCFGPARGFSKRFYTAFRCPDDTPNDATAYMFCRANNMGFVSVKRPRAIFRCPATVGDHVKQSARFASGKRAIIEMFGDAAREAYAIPILPLLLSMAREFLRHPILSAQFFMMWLYVRTYKIAAFSSLWEISESSKKLQNA